VNDTEDRTSLARGRPVRCEQVIQCSLSTAGTLSSSRPKNVALERLLQPSAHSQGHPSLERTLLASSTEVSAHRDSVQTGRTTPAMVRDTGLVRDADLGERHRPGVALTSPNLGPVTGHTARDGLSPPRHNPNWAPLPKQDPGWLPPPRREPVWAPSFRQGPRLLQREPHTSPLVARPLRHCRLKARHCLWARGATPNYSTAQRFVLTLLTVHSSSPPPASLPQESVVTRSLPRGLCLCLCLSLLLSLSSRCCRCCRCCLCHASLLLSLVSPGLPSPRERRAKCSAWCSLHFTTSDSTNDTMSTQPIVAFVNPFRLSSTHSGFCADVGPQVHRWTSGLASPVLSFSEPQLYWTYWCLQVAWSVTRRDRQFESALEEVSHPFYWLGGLSPLFINGSNSQQVLACHHKLIHSMHEKLFYTQSKIF